MIRLSQLLVVCSISAVCALAVSLVLIALGLRDSVPVGAAVSAASAAVVTSMGYRRAAAARE